MNQHTVNFEFWVENAVSYHKLSHKLACPIHLWRFSCWSILHAISSLCRESCHTNWRPASAKIPGLAHSSVALFRMALSVAPMRCWFSFTSLDSMVVGDVLGYSNIWGLSHFFVLFIFLYFFRSTVSNPLHFKPFQYYNMFSYFLDVISLRILEMIGLFVWRWMTAALSDWAPSWIWGGWRGLEKRPWI